MTVEPSAWMAGASWIPWAGANAFFMGVVSAALLVMLVNGIVMGLLAFQRKGFAAKWTAGPVVFAALSLGSFCFALLFAMQTLGQAGWSTPLKALAALSSVGLAAAVVWAAPRLHSVPSLEQVRLQGKDQLHNLTEELEAKDKAHTARIQESETRLHDQKLEALGILAGGLAHDFNNLLGAMAGNLELARMELGQGTAVQPYLETLEGLVSRSSELVQQVLAYSGRGQAQIVALDLNDQVERMTRLTRISLVQKPAFQMETARELPLITGDLAQVQQVIMNLVLNASEAVPPEGGLIAIRTGTEVVEPDALREHFQGQSLEPGLQVFLEVTDNGPGMAPEILERIFEPFYTTKFTGRGLGLSAVHGILRRHHGGIQVRSEPGAGTSFKVLFPVAMDVPAPVLPESPAFGETFEQYQGTGTVLVVDDEDPLRTVAVKALQRVGFHTLEARDGLEALHVFEAHQERIRLVLMDLTMPRMGGEEAYRVLRRSGVLVPVILSSGFTELDVLQHFHGKGIAGFLQKPYRLQALLTGVRQALDAASPSDGCARAREPLLWAKEMATGIPLLDSQHRSLLNSFNALVESVRQGTESQQERAFLLFKEVTLTHFGTEDRLMNNCAYPRRREHQATHASLIAQVDHLAERILCKELTFTPPVMDFLEGWLIHHMQEDDHELGRFLMDQGH